jgi:PncC family amidohydrolase
MCGLSAKEIAEKLSALSGCGVDFDVEELCLDAKVSYYSDGDRANFEHVKSVVYNLFEDFIYSASDIPLNGLAGKLLKMQGRVLSVAESLTGGEISSRLVDNGGISANFFEGIVCYNALSKHIRLGVPENMITRYGVVSKEVCHAMVQGVVRPPADLGLAVTGLAGPDGDEGKPVGLVYIGVGAEQFITVFEKHLTGSRNEIRKQTANLALFYLIRYLKGDILRL